MVLEGRACSCDGSLTSDIRNFGLRGIHRILKVGGRPPCAELSTLSLECQCGPDRLAIATSSGKPLAKDTEHERQQPLLNRGKMR